MNVKTPKILISCYACGPKWGSEVGMGWNWITHLARFCQLTVITESGFKEDIESALSTLKFNFELEFHYINIGQKARDHFWRQGDWRFYYYYKIWQQQAFILASRLISKESYDIIHQLNMIGYREPGYLWKLPIPFVWGPIGGYIQFPWRFLSQLGVRGALYHALRNIANSFQMRISSRVRCASHQAKVLIAATKDDKKAINKLYNCDAVVIPETGAILSKMNERKPKAKLKLVWSGIFQARKALPILLHALARICNRRQLQLEILGDGPEKKRWKKMALDLGVNNICHWHGRLNHDKALAIMKDADIFILTSLLEATSTVVLEALGYGVPVFCHDACGFGAVVNETCGIKIPLICPKKSVLEFASAIEKCNQDRKFLLQLKQGATQRSKNLSWQANASKVIQLYYKILSD